MVRLSTGHRQKIDLSLRQARRRIGEYTGRDRLQGWVNDKDGRVLRVSREVVVSTAEPMQAVDPARQQQPLAVVGSYHKGLKAAGQRERRLLNLDGKRYGVAGKDWAEIGGLILGNDPGSPSACRRQCKKSEPDRKAFHTRAFLHYHESKASVSRVSTRFPRFSRVNHKKDALRLNRSASCY